MCVVKDTNNNNKNTIKSTICNNVMYCKTLRQSTFRQKITYIPSDDCAILMKVSS